MNNQSFYQQINQAQLVTNQFLNDAIYFLQSDDDVDRYFIETAQLIDTLSLLPQQLDDFFEIENADDEIWDKLWENVNSAFSMIMENLELFSENNSKGINMKGLEYMWRLFGEAYNEIEDALDCNFSLDFNFDEKMKELQGQREC